MSAPSVLASVPTILERLHQSHPDARYELNWDSPLQLLVATISQPRLDRARRRTRLA